MLVSNVLTPYKIFSSKFKYKKFLPAILTLASNIKVLCNRNSKSNGPPIELNHYIIFTAMI